HNRFANADFFRKRREAVLVCLVCFEIEWVRRVQCRVVLGPAGIHQNVNTVVSRDFVVIAALRADMKISFEVLLPKRFLASAAFNPQPFRYYSALVRCFDRLFFTLEPRHRGENYSKKVDEKRKLINSGSGT